MTIERAIDVLKSECYVFNPLNFDRTTLINTALDTVIKALEKEPILDKIRAEIEQITDTMGVSYNQYVSKIDVLQIIDKYRAESEE